LALADWQYGLLVLSTVLIAAGYVINNILDQKTDAINKPNNVIIEKYFRNQCVYLYMALTVVGVAIGFICQM
jgi:4-hydroxybenzoate polyprenyltransferase